MHGEIVEFEGRICVRYTETLSTEPTAKTCYWSIFETAGSQQGFNRPTVGDLVTYSPTHRVWNSERNGHPTGFVRTDSAAYAVKFEPVSCPKVKAGIDTKWCPVGCQWEKLTKRGWVKA